MKTYFKTLVVLAVVAAFSAPARAQDQAAKPTQLRVQVVLSKYQGDKKISSLPFTLSVSSDHSRTHLRMGAQVPIVTAVTPDAKAATGIAPLQQVTYRDVGTNLDCSASQVADAYRIELTIDDSSVYTVEGQNAMRPGDHPSFRSFMASNNVVLKDGQSVQFIAATDKVSGETVKVDVTLTVVK